MTFCQQIVYSAWKPNFLKVKKEFRRRELEHFLFENIVLQILCLGIEMFI